MCVYVSFIQAQLPEVFCQQANKQFHSSIVQLASSRELQIINYTQLFCLWLLLPRIKNIYIYIYAYAHAHQWKWKILCNICVIFLPSAHTQNTARKICTFLNSLVLLLLYCLFSRRSSAVFRANFQLFCQTLFTTWRHAYARTTKEALVAVSQ